MPITEHEMDRRTLMLKARFAMIEAMKPFDDQMTAVEWMSIFYEMLGGSLKKAMSEEFECHVQSE